MKNNTLPLLNFEQSKRAAALGFDWDVTDYYDSLGTEYTGFVSKQFWLDKMKCIRRPTIALFLQWCREAKGIYGFVIVSTKPSMNCEYWVQTKESFLTFLTRNPLPYPEAETALVDELLNILEKNK